MNKLTIGAAAAFGVLMLTMTGANAQVCKNLATVDACVTCSVNKGGLGRFTRDGIRSWCQQQISQRPARTVPANQQRRDRGR